MAAIPYSIREQTGVLRSPSKFRPPAGNPQLVAREGIMQRIRQAAGTRLILVQAPAGFGITSLLRHIHDVYKASGCTIAWLTLDAGDNDLDRFLTCLGQTFENMQQGASPIRSMPRSAHLSAMYEGDSLELANAMASTPLPFMLILDEFEHLQNPAALAVVQQMIEMLGPQQQIVIGSREQPLLSVGRLRARQQLLEIDASQLRFNLQEAVEFLCEKRRLKIDEQDVASLHEITDGWPAALWLSSLAMQDSEDPKRFIRNFSGSNTAVASYLAEEVLSNKPKHLQDFILQTSILQKFCAESCNALTGRIDGMELLQEIQRSNMFMTAVDDQRNWFSYHPLFADFLRAQLDRQYPGLATRLHRRAATWYVSQSRPIPAIEHAIASGDRGFVLRLLAEHAETLFLQGRVRLLARWFDTIDRSSMVTHPKLISVYAWSLIHTNRSEEALTLLETVTGPDGASPIPHPTYNVVRIFALVMLDRIEETAPMWDDPRILSRAADEPLLRSMLMIGCAYYYATVGRYKDARLLLDQATQEHPAVGPLFSIAVAGYVRSMLDLAQGHLRAAVARLLALIGDESQMRVRSNRSRIGALICVGPDASEGRQGADSGFASLYMAEALYEMDSIPEARRLLKLYLPLVKDAGIPDQLITSHIIYSRILRDDGNPNEALQVLLDLEQLGMQRRLRRIVDSARLEQARAAILDGDAESAKAMLVLVGTSPPWQRSDVQMIACDIETPMLSAMRIQIHCGQAAAALAPLKEHLQEAYSKGRQRYALRVKVLYALALAQSGQRNPALRTLRETLQDALSEGFMRVFKDEGPALSALVREMLSGMEDISDPEHAALCEFAERIIRKPTARTVVAIHPGVEVVTEDSELTSRELDVLMLLAQGCGNQAIAEKLFVSVTTVKTHLRNINLKLGAHNRTEAISIARRRNIIS